MTSLTSAKRCQPLGNAPLFASLAENDLEAVASLARGQTLGAREELFHKGDEGLQISVVAF